MLQRESAEGERQTDLIILTHDTVEGRMRQALSADAGPADGAGTHRPHSQGRAGVNEAHPRSGFAAPPQGAPLAAWRSQFRGGCLPLRRHALRQHARRRTERAFCDILLEGLAPDGGLYLPSHYPRIDSATLHALAQICRYADLAFEILSLYIDDIPAADLRALCRQTYTAAVFGSDAIVPLKPLEAGRVACRRCPTARRWPSRTWRCSCSAACSSTNSARRGQALNILGATSGDTGSAAEHAMRGKRGINVFMLSPHGRMSPFQQAQMFSLQDANIHNIAIDGVFDDCQDIVKAVSNDLAFKRTRRIGTVNSINWARLLAQVVYYFAGYFQATKTDRRAGQLRRAVGQLRQHLRRPHRAHDGPADRPPDLRHQRERRARRVLPQRQLPAARQRPRRTRPRARRWTSARPATSSASCSTCSAATGRARACTQFFDARAARTRLRSR